MPIDAISGGFAYNSQARPVGGEERLADRVKEEREEQKPSLSATGAVERTESEEPREVRATAREDEVRQDDPRQGRGQSVNILI